MLIVGIVIAAVVVLAVVLAVFNVRGPAWADLRDDATAARRTAP